MHEAGYRSVGASGDAQALFGLRAMAVRGEELRAVDARASPASPIAFAAIAAITVFGHTNPLEPKPPPMNGEITCTRCRCEIEEVRERRCAPLTHCVAS